MDEQMERFRQELMGIGIISYREHDRLWDIAQHCARTAGIPTAGAGAVMGMGAGSVSIPGIGARRLCRADLLRRSVSRIVSILPTCARSTAPESSVSLKLRPKNGR